MLSTLVRSADLTRFKAIEDLECRYNESLVGHTTMKMRSRAGLVGIAHTPRALRDALRMARQLNVPTYIMGGGSNSLFASSYFDGLVLKMGREFQQINLVEPGLIRMGGALELKRAMSFAIECGLRGLEFAKGIPGTVGGAAAGNAGARDADKREWGMCDCIERLICFDRSGRDWEVEKGEFQYAYRASELAEVVVIQMDLRLEPAPAEEINQRLRFFGEQRKGQPYSLPSCGCIFKNPEDPSTGKKVSAGLLIDSLGLKGYRIGGAEISTQHANFMVNRNGASGEDFLALITLTQDMVRHKTGIDLDVEVEIVGGPLSHAIL